MNGKGKMNYTNGDVFAIIAMSSDLSAREVNTARIELHQVSCTAHRTHRHEARFAVDGVEIA